MIQLLITDVPGHHLRKIRTLLRNEPENVFYPHREDIGSLKLVVEEADPDVSIFEKYCSDNGIKMSSLSGTWVIYSKREMDKFDLFEMVAGEARFAANATSFGIAGACPKCGIGGAQVGPLLVSCRKTPKHEMVRVQAKRSFQWIISATLVEQLRSFTGFRLGEVRNAKTQQVIPDCYQLIVQNWLPRMATITDFTEFAPPLTNRCSCNRNGWNLQQELVYERSVLRHARDFNFTLEYFSGGGWADQHYVVTQQVRQLFCQNKYPNFLQTSADYRERHWNTAQIRDAFDFAEEPKGIN